MVVRGISSRQIAAHFIRIGKIFKTEKRIFTSAEQKVFGIRGEASVRADMKTAALRRFIPCKKCNGSISARAAHK